MVSDRWEEKAQAWLDEEACEVCSDIRMRKAHALAVLLRSVADEARREEAEEWTEELLTALNSELDGGDLNANVREILRRRGVKR